MLFCFVEFHGQYDVWSLIS